MLGEDMNIIRIIALCVFFVRNVPHRVYCIYLKFRYLRIYLASELQQEFVDTLNTLIGIAFIDRGAPVSACSRVFNCGIGHGLNDNRTICWEAPIGITVWLSGEPACAIGFELEGDTLCIKQLHGVSGAKDLRDIPDWPKLLVRCCMAMAEEAGLAGVRLTRANQTLFYKRPLFKTANGLTCVERRKQHRQRMRRRYDGTARQLGFTMNRQYSEWKNPEYT